MELFVKNCNVSHILEEIENAKTKNVCMYAIVCMFVYIYYVCMYVFTYMKCIYYLYVWNGMYKYECKKVYIVYTIELGKSVHMCACTYT